LDSDLLFRDMLSHRRMALGLSNRLPGGRLLCLLRVSVSSGDLLFYGRPILRLSRFSLLPKTGCLRYRFSLTRPGLDFPASDLVLWRAVVLSLLAVLPFPRDLRGELSPFLLKSDCFFLFSLSVFPATFGRVVGYEALLPASFFPVRVRWGLSEVLKSHPFFLGFRTPLPPSPRSEV